MTTFQKWRTDEGLSGTKVRQREREACACVRSNVRRPDGDGNCPRLARVRVYTLVVTPLLSFYMMTPLGKTE